MYACFLNLTVNTTRILRSKIQWMLQIHVSKYRLFAVWEVRTEKIFTEVLEAARHRRSRDASKTEGKYFSVRTDLNGK